MKPWALVRSSTGLRWHVVDSFGDAPRDREASTVRTVCGLYTWLADHEPVYPRNLYAHDLTCKRCHRKAVRRAEWYAELAEEIGRHT